MNKPTPEENACVGFVRARAENGNKEDAMVAEYIDSLQSALQVAQQELDRLSDAETADAWILSDTVSKLTEAEERNKRMVELLRKARLTLMSVEETNDWYGIRNGVVMKIDDAIDADLALKEGK
jgi:hypothetical protein